MVKEESKDESHIRPSFDGRQHFYKTLNKYQESLGTARFDGDFVSMEQSLRGFLTMVSPYINKSEGIEKQLNTIKKFLKPRFINKFRDHIDTLLNKVTFDLFEQSKHMMLPFSEEDNEEFDMERFKRESDL